MKESRELLEFLVSTALDEWQIYNINPSTDNYMSDSDITDAMNYVIKKVMLEMTQTTKEILSIGYPFETEDQMIESIKNKTKIVVLNYSVTQNEAKDHNEVIKNINTF